MSYPDGLIHLPITNNGSVPPGMPDSSFSQISNADLEFAVRELERYAPFYEQARLYAQGQSPELFFVSEAARMQVAQMIDAFRFNFAGLVIKTIANRLSIVDFANADETIIEDLIDANKLWTWSGQSIYETLVDGDHYVIVREDADDAPPTLIPSSATETRVFYDAETERTAELAIRQWKMRDSETGKTITRVNLWYPDHIERFFKPKDGAWEPYSSDDFESEEGHDFGQVPVAHWRTGFPYGTPLHRDAFGPQDAIVKAIMTLMASTEFSGWSQRYVLHDLAQAGQSALPGQTQTDRAPRMRSGPGTLWDLYGREAGSFPSADLDKLINVVSLAVRSMAQVTETPMHYFDPSGEVPSGESLLVADAPVGAKAIAQRRSIGSGAGHMIELGAIAMGDKSGQVVTVWAPDPIVSDETWWKTAQIRHELGVSKEQIFTEAGYTEQQIATFSVDQSPLE